MKADIPTAFTKGKPFQPIAVFIDGQIKLNSAYNEVTQTWDEYMRRQFLFTIQSYFRQPNSSINTVILAFDNYSLVPHAKNMTQVRLFLYSLFVPPCLVSLGFSGQTAQACADCSV